MENIFSNLEDFSDDSLNKYLFTKAEHQLWKKIFIKQINNLRNKAIPVFFENYKVIQLTAHQIPNLFNFNKMLLLKTGWQIRPVNGLIDEEYFFYLLSKKLFPIATHLRTNNEHNLSKDPDIFHDIFGHCTMLASKKYAFFLEEIAKLASSLPKSDLPIMTKLIWFSTETGLIITHHGIRIFGSSLLSSFKESNYCLNSKKPILKPFNLIDIFREPYRADIMQNVYYVLKNQEQLYNILTNIETIKNTIKCAKELGEFEPKFEITNDKYCNYGKI